MPFTNTEVETDETTFEEAPPSLDEETTEEAPLTFELTDLPARKGGAGGPRGPRGPRYISEEMVEALVQSENPNAAIKLKYKNATPELKEWAAERTLKIVTREGDVYLTKLPAEEG